jgi:ribosomal protein L3 glutamine methyltransferase
MDFIRPLLQQAAARLNPGAVLVLEIGNERDFFEAAFPHLTSSGCPPAPATTRCCSSPAMR